MTKSNNTIRFQISVVRCATAFHTPWVLNQPRAVRRAGGSGGSPNRNNKLQTRFVAPPVHGQHDPHQPPTANVSGKIEEYTVILFKDVDCRELPFAVEEACGIPSRNLRLCLAEEIEYQEEDEDMDREGNGCMVRSRTVVQRHTRITRLLFLEDEGSCGHFFQTNRMIHPDNVVHIVAFESTLRPRPPPPLQSVTDAAMEEEDMSTLGVEVEIGRAPSQEMKSLTSSTIRRLDLKALLDVYGNGTECRVYDTETLSIAQAISQSTWPRNEQELRIGLRVDAMDHTGKWYPGTIVEIISPSSSSKGSSSSSSRRKKKKKAKIRVHFDNFSSKWDELFTMEQIFGEQSSDHHHHHHDSNDYPPPPKQVVASIAPLYTIVSTPRTKPTEFIVHHRYTNRNHPIRRQRQSHLFGQSFVVQCHNEWSTARAAAHIIAQASRFVNHPPPSSTTTRSQRLYDRTQKILSDLIDKLIDADRNYVQDALGVTRGGMTTTTATRHSKSTKLFCNPGFDPTPLTTSLHESLQGILRRLPFELTVCTQASLLPTRTSSGSQDSTNYPPQAAPFPFSLERTIGNYMNGHLVVVLQWREPPSDSPPTSSRSSFIGTVVESNSYQQTPVMYVAPPRIAIPPPPNHHNLPSRPSSSYDDQNSQQVLEHIDSWGSGGSGTLRPHLHPQHQQPPQGGGGGGPIRTYRYIR